MGALFPLFMTRPCPVCNQPAELLAENRHRPFCSERCKLVDLSKWFGGEYVIPGYTGSQLPDGREISEEPS